MTQIPVGELFILGFNGAQLAGWIQEFEATYGLGGIILFDYHCPARAYERNIFSPDQVKDLCSSIHARKSQPLICIDQEGGKVRRLKENRGFRPLVGADIFPTLPINQRQAMTLASFQEMVDLGIHFDLAPVVDLNLNPENPDIAQKGRTFSADPKVVCENALLQNDIAKKVGLGLCLKHFPGVGAGAKNSHEELLDLSDVLTPAQEEIFYELIPQISQQAVLVSHGLINQWEPGRPASISKVALGRLRQRCPEALIISDDLDMQGLLRIMSTQEACIAGIEAGLDLIIIGNNMADNTATLPGIAYAIQEKAATDPKFRAQCETAIARTRQRKNFFYNKH